MLARILVPLDGSALAERALPVAARLARASGGALLLLRVYQVMLSEFTPALAGDDTGDAREARAYLARVSERADLAGIPTEQVALGGAVARAILDAVAAYKADTIVMTSHGRSGAVRRALGSVAERVSQQTPVPTLVLRGEDFALPEMEPSAGVVWRAFIGLDGSELSGHALEPAARLLRALAGAAPAEARLLTIIPPATPGGAEQAESTLRAAAARLESGDLARHTIHARWAVIEAVDAADTLAAAAEHPDRLRWHARQTVEGDERAAEASQESSGTRLIALATHGGAALRRWALGYVTERVLEGSQLPLLIVPA